MTTGTNENAYMTPDGAFYIIPSPLDYANNLYPDIFAWLLSGNMITFDWALASQHEYMAVRLNRSDSERTKHTVA